MATREEDTPDFGYLAEGAEGEQESRADEDPDQGAPDFGYLAEDAEEEPQEDSGPDVERLRLPDSEESDSASPEPPPPERGGTGGGRFGIGLGGLELTEEDQPSGLTEIQDMAEQMAAQTADYSTELGAGALELLNLPTEPLIEAAGAPEPKALEESADFLQEQAEKTQQVLGEPDTRAGRIAGVVSRLGLEGLGLAAGARALGVPSSASTLRRVGQGLKAFGPIDALIGASGEGGAPAVAELAGQEEVARTLREHPALGAAAEVGLGASADLVLEAARGARAADEATAGARRLGEGEGGTPTGLEDLSDRRLRALSGASVRQGDGDLSRRASIEIDRRLREAGSEGGTRSRSGREATEEAEDAPDPDELFTRSEEPDEASEGGFAQLPGEDFFRPFRKVGEKAKSWWTRNFTTAGDLPEEVFERKVEKRGSIRAELQQSREVLRDFDAALKEVKGTARLNEDEARVLDEALKGERPLSELPEPIRPVLHRMRDHIDALS